MSSKANLDDKKANDNSQHFKYVNDLDENGLFYYLGTNGGADQYVNPVSSGKIKFHSSTISHGSADTFIGRDNRPSWTADVKNSFFVIDLDLYSFKPTHYTLKNSWNDKNYITNWSILGSKDGNKWISIKKHTNDHSLKGKYKSSTFQVNTSEYYRYFKIVMTDKNNVSSWSLYCSGIEFYGNLSKIVGPSSIFVVNNKLSEMINTVKMLTASGKGLLAADESIGTIGKRFDMINVKNTEINRRRYRELLFTTEKMNKYISGVILFEETLYQNASNGKSFVDILNKNGIVVGIKADQGTRALPYCQNDKYTQGISDLDIRARKYYAAGARFAKWRVVFSICNGYISSTSISENALNLARYASICQREGLVPIIEPEILMNGNHSLEINAYWTRKVLTETYSALSENNVIFEATLLKPNMCIAGIDNHNNNKEDVYNNARATINALKQSVPTAVPGIMFLSGGQTELNATLHLNAINKLLLASNSGLPWKCLSFSYGRALQTSCLKIWNGNDHNIVQAQNTFLYRSELNSLASLGAYNTMSSDYKPSLTTGIYGQYKFIKIIRNNIPSLSIINSSSGASRSLINFDDVIRIAKLYNRASTVISEISLKLPFQKSTNNLIAKCIVQDLMMNKSNDINLKNDINSDNSVYYTPNPNTDADNLIASFSSNTLLELGQIVEDKKYINIGINGFGRIGRMVLRASLKRKNINVIAVNDPFIKPKYMVYMFKYDTVQGTFEGDVSTDGTNLIINGKKIKIFSEKKPANIPWGKNGVVYVAECTGVFKESDTASLHLKGGAKKVIISAPSKTVPMFCVNINTSSLNYRNKLFSNASCTTNCLAPIVAVLNDNFGISSGLMTTVHAVTSTQQTIDAPSKKNYRIGRCGYNNIIPSSTGAAKAIGKIIPQLNGKLNGMCFRVPVPCGSVVDLTCLLKKDVTKNDICNVMKKASLTSLSGILGYNSNSIVSQDIIGDDRSSIFDSQKTMVIGKRLVKIISWYDNEWGYSVRLLDLCEFIAKKEGRLYRS